MKPYLKKIQHKNRAGVVAQGVFPEFKPQYCKKERERKRQTERERERQRMP
jgi:glutamine amidotransferase-like uncharacterized protein